MSLVGICLNTNECTQPPKIVKRFTAALLMTAKNQMGAFKLWCWRRLLGVPWTARRSSQSILKEINPEIFIGRTDADAEAETPILRPPDVNSQLTVKDPDAGKD